MLIKIGHSADTIQPERMAQRLAQLRQEMDTFVCLSIILDLLSDKGKVIWKNKRNERIFSIFVRCCFEHLSSVRC